MDKFTLWQKKLEAAKEYGMYFDYRAVAELLEWVKQLKNNERVLGDMLNKSQIENDYWKNFHKYFDADDQH